MALNIAGLEFLDRLVLGIPIYEIIIALVIIGIFALIGKTINYFLKTVAKKLTAKTKSDLDDKIVEALDSPITAAVVVIGVYVAFWFLQIQETGTQALFENLIFFLSVVVVAWALVRLTDVLVAAILLPLTKKTKSNLDDVLIPVFSKVVKALIVLFAVLVMLDNLGYDVTAILAGLGIGGLAVAFAARETIANIFGGISLIFDKAFKIGDRIKLPSGETATVEDIGLRSTKFRTFENEVLMVPNANLANSILVNYSSPKGKTWLNVPFTVEYGTKLEKVENTILPVLKKIDFVAKEPEPIVRFTNMGDFALEFKAMFWIEDINYKYTGPVEVRKAIYNALNKAKIGIPFPTRTIYTKKA